MAQGTPDVTQDGTPDVTQDVTVECRAVEGGDVYVLTMAAGENRWTTTFTRALAAALDEVLARVEAGAGPAALVTASADPKFFSNGLDVEWVRGRGEHPGGDRSVFAVEAMAVFSRVMTFPIPTVAAIGGHAFGAGFMVALCHDVRVMRRDRGFLCANELEIGIAIPDPELALFRHKMSLPAFYETVQLARRWTAPDAAAAGFVQHVVEADEVLPAAIERARRLLPLSRNRVVFGGQKQRLFGADAAIAGAHGAAHMLAHPGQFGVGH
ncbi:MAG: enoyl-CoA hydratase/isomerase family protein [Acidimicrobiales bacterium]